MLINLPYGRGTTNCLIELSLVRKIEVYIIRGLFQGERCRYSILGAIMFW